MDDGPAQQQQQQQPETKRVGTGALFMTGDRHRVKRERDIKAKRDTHVRIQYSNSPDRFSLNNRAKKKKKKLPYKREREEKRGGPPYTHTHTDDAPAYMHSALGLPLHIDYWE